MIDVLRTTFIFFSWEVPKLWIFSLEQKATNEAEEAAAMAQKVADDAQKVANDAQKEPFKNNVDSFSHFLC